MVLLAVKTWVIMTHTHSYQETIMIVRTAGRFFDAVTLISLTFLVAFIYMAIANPDELARIVPQIIETIGATVQSVRTDIKSAL